MYTHTQYKTELPLGQTKGVTLSTVPILIAVKRSKLLVQFLWQKRCEEYQGKYWRFQTTRIDVGEGGYREQYSPRSK